MAGKARRLRFTEDDLSDRDIRKAAQKAEKAADKADKANEKLPTKRRVRITRDSGKSQAVEERLSDKLRPERQSAEAVKGKLRVEVTEARAKKPGAAGRAVHNAPQPLSPRRGTPSGMPWASRRTTGTGTPGRTPLQSRGIRCSDGGKCRRKQLLQPQAEAA